MLLKVYIVTIVVFWIALLIVDQIIKIQLKKDGLHERMKELNKEESLIDPVKNVSGCVILSIVPVINIIMAGYMFIGIDAIYIKVKEKCLPEHCALIVIKSVFNYCHDLLIKKKDKQQYYMMHDPDFAIRLESIAKEQDLDLENGDVLAFWVCKKGANILDSDQLKECLRS